MDIGFDSIVSTLIESNYSKLLIHPYQQKGPVSFMGSRPFCFVKNTLARTYSSADIARSTMGAMGLNFRVRDGNGCFPHAMSTKDIVVRQDSISIVRGGKGTSALSRFLFFPRLCYKHLFEASVSLSDCFFCGIDFQSYLARAISFLIRLLYVGCKGILAKQKVR